MNAGLGDVRAAISALSGSGYFDDTPRGKPESQDAAMAGGARTGGSNAESTAAPDALTGDGRESVGSTSLSKTLLVDARPLDERTPTGGFRSGRAPPGQASGLRTSKSVEPSPSDQGSTGVGTAGTDGKSSPLNTFEWIGSSVGGPVAAGTTGRLAALEQFARETGAVLPSNPEQLAPQDIYDALLLSVPTDWLEH